MEESRGLQCFLGTEQLCVRRGECLPGRGSSLSLVVEAQAQGWEGLWELGLVRKSKQEMGLKRSARARPQSRDHRLAFEKHLPSDSLVW